MMYRCSCHDVCLQGTFADIDLVSLGTQAGLGLFQGAGAMQYTCHDTCHDTCHAVHLS